MERLTIEVREVPPLRALSVTRHTTADAIGEAVGGVYPLLFEAGGRAGRITGPPVCAYPTAHAWDPADVVVVPGVPYEGAAPDGFDVTELEGGPAVVGTYLGPYDELPAAWEQTMAFVSANELALRSTPYELYRVTHGDAPPQNFETDIVVPVGAAGA